VIDRLLVDLDLIQTDDDLGEEAQIAMIGGAEGFLRAGGIVTWDFWVSLGDASRNAFIIARQRIKNHEIALSALANSSRSFALELMSQVDGGEAKMYHAINRVLDHAENKLRGNQPVELNTEIPK
tara:strand:+ start:65 stop:439 length:375 start_codon:yes stop_codon:yes gene_type:complete